MAPLVLLLLWITSFLDVQVKKGLITEITALLGREDGAVIGLVIENANEQPSLGNVAGIISLLTLAFGATGVFAELQSALM